MHNELNFVPDPLKQLLVYQIIIICTLIFSIITVVVVSTGRAYMVYTSQYMSAGVEVSVMRSVPVNSNHIVIIIVIIVFINNCF